jgi:putative transposase
MVIQSKTEREKIGLWRFGLLASVLSDPPAIVQATLEEIVKGSHLKDPISMKPTTVSIRTLYRWYSIAKNAQNPYEALMPRCRSDKGKSRVMTKQHESILVAFYSEDSVSRSWSWLLVFQNFEASLQEVQPEVFIPSYATVRRFFMRMNLFPVPVASSKGERALAKKRKHGTNLFEVEHVGGLVHLDYHVCSIKILTRQGTLATAYAMAIIDDRSRHVGHFQWFTHETCENLVHVVQQYILRRGMFRASMNDNGAAMIAEEFVTGCEKLGIALLYSEPAHPWQNGKIESFWKPLENRLIAMLQGVQGLTLDELNSLTQAWVEQDYNRSIHSELNDTPLNVFMNRKNVLRPSANMDVMRQAFRIVVKRQQRMTDHTITIEKVRFKIPREYWHEQSIRVAYARWDLSFVHIINDETGTSIARIYPVDKKVDDPKPAPEPLIRDNLNEIVPPLLRKFLKSYRDTHAVDPILRKE